MTKVHRGSQSMDLETIANPERLARGVPRDISPSSSSPSSCRTYSLDSRSSVSTKPSSRGSSPAVQKEDSGGARSRSRRSPKHVAPSWDLMFHPRSYEEIYAERAYLTASLQMYSMKAIEMIHQYSLIEEEFQAKEPVGKQRRKLRKQMSFIKVKLSEASRQEKAVIIRLSELQMEQLGRDTWDQVQQRRLFYAAFSSSTSPPPKTSLSANSGEFIPSTIHSDNPPVHAPGSLSEMEKSKTLDTVIEAKEGEEDDEEIPEEGGKEAETGPEKDVGSKDLCNHGLKYTYQVCGDEENSELRPPHIRERLSSCSEEKRMSLPSLCSIWPGA
ncbi:hypothetical protein V8C37DRAFT_10480 [Trichoderma ceciliae]